MPEVSGSRIDTEWKPRNGPRPAAGHRFRVQGARRSPVAFQPARSRRRRSLEGEARLTKPVVALDVAGLVLGKPLLPSSRANLRAPKTPSRANFAPCRGNAATHPGEGKIGHLRCRGFPTSSA